MTVPRIPSLNLAATLVPEHEALQILEAWVNECLTAMPATLAALLKHWGCGIQRYPGSWTAGYVGPERHKPR